METEIQVAILVTRLVMYAALLIASIACVAVGATIFFRQINYILKRKELTAQDEARIDLEGASIKATAGVSLVIVGLISGHMLLWAPITSTIEGREIYGVGLVLPSITLSSSAFAAEADQRMSELADYCSFTVERGRFISQVRGADGSALPLARRQILRALNRTTNGVPLTPEQTRQVFEALVSDEQLVRHIRYILVQSGIEMGQMMEGCGEFLSQEEPRPPPDEDGALGKALQLLNDGVQP